MEEFRYNIGAEDRVARGRVADQQDPEFRGFFDVGALGIANAYGDPPYPLLSADRSYWWDRSTWRDTTVSVPDGAPRSADGAQWFYGVAWRPVTPSPAAHRPRTT